MVTGDDRRLERTDRLSGASSWRNTGQRGDAPAKGKRTNKTEKSDREEQRYTPEDNAVNGRPRGIDF